jgi:hypothetical protein
MVTTFGVLLEVSVERKTHEKIGKFGYSFTFQLNFGPLGLKSALHIFNFRFLVRPCKLIEN